MMTVGHEKIGQLESNQLDHDPLLLLPVSTQVEAMEMGCEDGITESVTERISHILFMLTIGHEWLDPLLDGPSPGKPISNDGFPCFMLSCFKGPSSTDTWRLFLFLRVATCDWRFLHNGKTHQNRAGRIVDTRLALLKYSGLDDGVRCPWGDLFIGDAVHPPPPTDTTDPSWLLLLESHQTIDVPAMQNSGLASALKCGKKEEFYDFLCHTLSNDFT